MKYALNLSEDGRILSATYEQYAPADSVLVDTLPEGDITHYRYENGQYVYDPPKPKENAHVVAPCNILIDECITINGVMYKAIENIPNGASIITGQNAVITTVEEQLFEMTKGE
jgi:FKBP-type peptidyl-prolyl cis-trans isomerase 2